MSVIRFSATVMRRARGVYLAQVSEDRHGTEDCDAFATEARAKAWCAKWCEQPRLPWVEHHGSRDIWHAHLEVEDSETDT